MAMNIDSLERALKKAFGGKLRYQVHRDSEAIEMVWGGFDHYRDPNGEDSITIVILLQSAGEYLEVMAPRIYDASGSRHVGALCRVLLGTSMRTNVVQFSLNDSTGEIQASAELPLMDGTCTPKQLRVTIEIVKDVVDRFHPHVVRAMETGEISYPEEGTIDRPTLEDSESEDGPLGSVDVGEALRAAIKQARAEGRKMWEDAVPPRDPGRHA